MGWATSQHAVKSQAQTPSLLELAQDGQPGRVGGGLEEEHVGVGGSLQRRYIDNDRVLTSIDMA